MSQNDFDVLFAKYPRTCPEDTYFEHGSGWLNVLDKYFAEIEAILPPEAGWRNGQIKEKYGPLSFDCQPVWPDDFDYFANSDKVKEVGKAISMAEVRAEMRSSYTCEKCGKPGVLRGQGWLFTACDEHSKGVEPMKNATGIYKVGSTSYRYDPDIDDIVVVPEVVE